MVTWASASSCSSRRGRTRKTLALWWPAGLALTSTSGTSSRAVGSWLSFLGWVHCSFLPAHLFTQYQHLQLISDHCSDRLKGVNTCNRVSTPATYFRSWQCRAWRYQHLQLISDHCSDRLKGINTCNRISTPATYFRSWQCRAWRYQHLQLISDHCSDRLKGLDTRNLIRITPWVGDVAQLVEGQTGTRLREVWFPGARDFSTRVNFQHRLSFGVQTLLCAIACFNIYVHIKEPAVHVRVQWITETLKHPACTVGWVAWLLQLAFPRESNPNSHGRNPNETIE